MKKWMQFLVLAGSISATGTLLDSQTLTNFANGQYLVWDLRGHLTIRVTNTGIWNAVLNGLFFQPVPVPDTQVATPTISPNGNGAGLAQLLAISTCRPAVEASPKACIRSRTW